MAFIRRLLPAAVCTVAMALSGAVASPPVAALVPCGFSLKGSPPADGPSHPGQFSPESGPCDDNVPSSPQLQPPALILPA